MTITPINKYGTAKFIVSATAGEGNYTTITSAMAAATSGDIIFVKQGSYTENFTAKGGTVLTAFPGGQSGSVQIVGKITFTDAGVFYMSDIDNSTNSDFFLVVSGANLCTVNLSNCFFGCTSTGISFTNSNAGSQININQCGGDLGSTSIAFHSSSSAGTLTYYDFQGTNSGGSTTGNSNSAGNVKVNYSNFANPFSTSSTGVLTSRFLTVDTSAQNAASIALAGSGSNIIRHSSVLSGTAAGITIGSGCTLSATNVSVNSSNAAVISGAGTLNHSLLSFITNDSVTVTTQTPYNIGPSVNIGSSNSGNTNTLTVKNSSNTATSSANILSSVAGSTAADPTHQATVSGTTTWTWGIDNSVTTPSADPWVMSQGTALGTNDVMSVDTTGVITYPLQSAFLGYNNTLRTDVTGDGTVFTIPFDAEVFDQNADFNTANGTFTAPITGRYHLGTQILAGGYTSSHTSSLISIVTSNRTYQISDLSPAGAKDANNNLIMGGIVLADMDAADTSTITIVVGGGTKVVDLVVSLYNQTFSGFLAC